MSKLLVLIAVFAIVSIALPVLAVLNFVPSTVYLIASLGVSMAMVIFLVIIFIFSRGVLEPVLASRLTGKAMWIIITATRRFKFVIGDLEQRVFSTKYFGSYLVDPEASFMWPHGVSGAIANTSRGINLHPDIIKACTAAKEKGYENYKDLENAKDKNEVLVEGIDTSTGRPLLINDVIKYFKYNLNPSYIQSVIKLAVAREKEGRREFPTSIVLTIGILLVCAGVAYTIITGAQSGKSAMAELGKCQSQLSQCQLRVVGPTTQTTTTTVPQATGGDVIA